MPITQEQINREMEEEYRRLGIPLQDGGEVQPWEASVAIEPPSGLPVNSQLQTSAIPTGNENLRQRDPRGFLPDVGPTPWPSTTPVATEKPFGKGPVTGALKKTQPGMSRFTHPATPVKAIPEKKVKPGKEGIKKPEDIKIQTQYLDPTANNIFYSIQGNDGRTIRTNNKELARRYKERIISAKTLNIDAMSKRLDVSKFYAPTEMGMLPPADQAVQFNLARWNTIGVSPRRATKKELIYFDKLIEKEYNIDSVKNEQEYINLLKTILSRHALTISGLNTKGN